MAHHGLFRGRDGELARTRDGVEPQTSQPALHGDRGRAAADAVGRAATGSGRPGRRAGAESGPMGRGGQSGATACGPFLVRAVENGSGFSYIMSTGNEAALDFTDFGRYLLDDPDTRVIAGFVEGVKEADKFLEVAKIAAERGKPIVLIKIGRSELGARAARSHTAALPVPNPRYIPIFAQYRGIRVHAYHNLP